MQPSAKTKFTELLEFFNLYIESGKFHAEDVNFLRIKKDIQSLKSIDARQYLCCSACYAFMIGDIDGLKDATRRLLSLGAKEHETIQSLTSLSNAGLHKEFVEISKKHLDLTCTSNYMAKLCLLGKSGYLSAAIEFEELLIRSKLMNRQDISMISSANNCHQILNNAGIQESTLTSILSVAGSIVRSRKLTTFSTYKYYFHNNDQVSIIIPVRASSELIAEIDWELSMQLVENYSSNILHHILVSFCSLTSND